MWNNFEVDITIYHPKYFINIRAYRQLKHCNTVTVIAKKIKMLCMRFICIRFRDSGNIATSSLTSQMFFVGGACRKGKEHLVTHVNF